MLLRVLAIVAPIFAIAAAGYGYGRWKRPDMTFANQLTMDVFVPALVFYVLSAKSFALTSYGYLALGGLALVLGSGVVLLPLVWLLNLRASTFLPPMMICW